MTCTREHIAKEILPIYAAFWREPGEDWEDVLSVWETILGEYHPTDVSFAFRRAAKVINKIEELQPPLVRSFANAPNEPMLFRVVDATAEVSGITKEWLLGPRRDRRFSWPRQAGMYVASEVCTDKSYPQIARAFRRGCHTTVMHAHREVAERLKTDEWTRQMVEGIRGMV